MGKFRCVCGEVISTSGNTDDGWFAVRERMFMASWDAEEPFDDVFDKITRMYVCPKSGHIWVFWGGWSEPASCYEPRSALVRANIDDSAEPHGQR
jgi:hypothetical protein